ncbi:hypothetical protein J6590_015610 [Homalodisca vitripennis]|nr:hypothetical protein J6590_015610 [Homalodisca vitripennis]
MNGGSKCCELFYSYILVGTTTTPSMRMIHRTRKERLWSRDRDGFCSLSIKADTCSMVSTCWGGTIDCSRIALFTGRLSIEAGGFRHLGIAQRRLWPKIHGLA